MVQRACESDKARLLNIMAGLPGAYDRYDIPGLRRMLDRYSGITPTILRENLARFLREIIPLAEELGMRFAIHPDDPPRPLMGLPRIVSNAEDLAFILSAVESNANGLTLCSGSLGAGPRNDVPAIARRFADCASISRICAMSPRTPTAPSWKPTTSTATPTWSRW